MLHAEVIAPSLRRIRLAARAGEIDAERERLAQSITKRVLATLSRYMAGATAQTRERVLLASIDEDEHTLGLQMVHDQLAAAGFRANLDTGLQPERICEVADCESADVVVLGSISDGVEDAVELALREFRASHPRYAVRARGPRRRRRTAARVRRPRGARTHRRLRRGGRRAARGNLRVARAIARFPG